jgi:hypothetical protein
MTREDAKRKVRALLNTAADGSGATRFERETARALAERMIERHGLDDAEPARGAFIVTVSFG